MNKKFVPHTNLSDGINFNIMQSERNGGLNLNEVLIGQSFNVQTENTLYHFIKTTDNEYHVNGHPTYCPEPTPCRICGSTWGGSMMKMRFVGIGMCLEMYLTQKSKRLLTSEIVSFKLL